MKLQLWAEVGTAAARYNSNVAHAGINASWELSVVRPHRSTICFER